MSLDFGEKDKVHELAREIKKNIDFLVNDLGVQAVKPLDDIRGMKDWIVLKGQAPFTILLAMKMYLDGVVTTLYREKKDC